MAKKTTYEVVAIYDGKLDAADVFANLIYEKYQKNFLYQQKENLIVEGGETAYNTTVFHILFSKKYVLQAQSRGAVS